MNTSLDELINRADLDGLVRHVDATCAARDWAHLLEVRDRARAAVSTGRQLWPIATLANFRLALWAPAVLAVRALDDTVRTFMPGPVSEILAVHHSWAELTAHLPIGHDRSLVAHERALRGESVPGSADESALEVPVQPLAWEPAYALATYSDDGLDAPAPEMNLSYGAVEPVSAAAVIDDSDTTVAFRRLVEPWTAQSNGMARLVVVDGGAPEALGALGLTSVDVAELDARTAVAWLAWAGASGGAHGKRRGAATGRAEAWWFLASFTGLDEPWPCDGAELGEVVGSLGFAAWRHRSRTDGGWNLRLVVNDRHEGVCAALEATDRA